MDRLIAIIYDNIERPMVNYRGLLKALAVSDKFSQWFSSTCEYSFTEKRDFITILGKSTGGRLSVEHQITIPMAKEIWMLQYHIHN